MVAEWKKDAGEPTEKWQRSFSVARQEAINRANMKINVQNSSPELSRMKIYNDVSWVLYIHEWKFSSTNRTRRIFGNITNFSGTDIGHSGSKFWLCLLLAELFSTSYLTSLNFSFLCKIGTMVVSKHIMRLEWNLKVLSLVSGTKK